MEANLFPQNAQLSCEKAKFFCETGRKSVPWTWKQWTYVLHEDPPENTVACLVAWLPGWTANQQEIAVTLFR